MKCSKIIWIIIFSIIVIIVVSSITVCVRENLKLTADEPIEIHTTDPDHPHSTMPTTNLMNTILVSQLSPEAQQNMKTAIVADTGKGEDLPKTFDCRVKWKGMISQPLNQGQCGSCWAFSTATSASDRLRIASNGRALMTPIIYYLHYGGQVYKVNTIDTLSPYHLAACNNCDIMMKMGDVAFAKWMLDNNQCNHECNGGVIPYAYNFISKWGIASMACEYRKKGHQEKYVCEAHEDCDMWGSKNRDPKKDVRQLVGVAAIKRALVERGPIVGGYQVYQSFMDFFKNPANKKKAYPDPADWQNQRWKDKIDGGHAVAIVGWDKDDKGEFWIIRNSWGKFFSDDGYFRMYIGMTGIEDGCYEIVM